MGRLFCMMGDKRKTHPLLMRWMGLSCLKVTKQLAHEDAAGVSCFAAIEGEQQI